MDKITSLTNTTIKNLTKLHTKKERDKTSLFLIEGDHLLEEAGKHNLIDRIYTDTPEKYSFFSNVTEVTPQILSKLSANVSKVHVIAVCHKPTLEITSYNRLLLLDNIQDPGNLGTLIRTAVSFGFDGVVCNAETCDVYSEKTIRSTQGAVFQIPILYTELSSYVKALQSKGVQVIATSLRNAKGMKNILPIEKMAFILGNEGQGVSNRILEQSDERLFIEMGGFESLNVAVAGGIIMYHYANNSYPNQL